MVYKTIKLFTDGKDGGYQYNPGDEYPRKGYTPTPERIAELSSNRNKRGEAMIAEVKDEPKKEEKAEKVEAVKETKKKTTKKK